LNSLPQPGVFPAVARSLSLSAGAVGRVLFLDRDGVINVNHGYVHTPEQTDWVPGIFELCNAARDAGYALVVVTNQAGIARGYYSEAQFLAYTRWVHEQFAARDVPLLATYYCPHHPQAALDEYRLDCACRKPQPGMILTASRDLGLQLSECLLIGDMPSDQQAADAAGVGRSWLLDALPTDLRVLFGD
jgi:D-glycero-D-manno-heptose 1,7-bisphosphate phosphatase